jgi:hypothetical protein
VNSYPEPAGQLPAVSAAGRRTPFDLAAADYDRVGELNGKDLIARGWRACCLQSAGAIVLGCGSGGHAVLLRGNIYGRACALDVEGPHAKAVALHGLMLRAAGHRGVCGRSECAPAWWPFGKCLPSVHAHDDLAQLPWTSAASFRIS